MNDLGRLKLSSLMNSMAEGKYNILDLFFVYRKHCPFNSRVWIGLNVLGPIKYNELSFTKVCAFIRNYWKKKYN